MNQTEKDFLRGDQWSPEQQAQFAQAEPTQIIYYCNECRDAHFISTEGAYAPCPHCVDDIGGELVAWMGGCVILMLAIVVVLLWPELIMNVVNFVDGIIPR